MDAVAPNELHANAQTTALNFELSAGCLSIAKLLDARHHDIRPHRDRGQVEHDRFGMVRNGIARVQLECQFFGIVERFHKTVLNEFYRVAFRRKIYRSTAELQEDLDAWVADYNEQRPHQGRWCFGKTPMQTFLDAKPLAQEKMIAA